MKYILISLFAVVTLNLNSQINLNKISASATSTGTTVNVFYTTLEALPAGFMNPINVVFKTPIASASSAVFTITSNPYGLGYSFDFDGGDGFQYFMFQSVTAINTTSWPHPSTINIATFNITGVSSVTLTTYGQFGNFWNGTAANLGDDNLVTWPIDVFLPLPIKLTSFTAVKEGGRNALLDWRSSSESNSAYYGIERSVDGINWEPIAQVTAAGNSSDERTYSYLDRTLPLSRALNQIFYYRLRLVDFDGKFEYSDVRSVIFDKVETHGDIALFPNPASHLAQLDVSGLDVSDGDIHLRVTDMSGKVVLTKDILGNSVEPINVLEWNSGNYNFTVTQGEKLYNKRFIKVD